MKLFILMQTVMFVECLTFFLFITRTVLYLVADSEREHGAVRWWADIWTIWSTLKGSLAKRFRLMFV